MFTFFTGMFGFCVGLVLARYQAATAPAKALPPSPQCFATTSPTGVCQCEGVADPWCVGRMCRRHCLEHCGGRCDRIHGT